jgi:hypothetical protein
MERFSILLDVSYLAGGKMLFWEDKGSPVYRDLSGISATLSLKAYLF